VTHPEGQAQAAEWGVQFMETSAKTNHNVTELFQVWDLKLSRQITAYPLKIFAFSLF
jgi:hypothetical protein